jgi:nitrite reductase/ring-hydroxylating ferredoxin subunit
LGKLRVNKRKPHREGKIIKVARETSLPPGRGGAVKLPDGTELALFNTGERFCSIENFCPHKGYPLADSPIKENIVTCEHHGWEFDVRTGRCLEKKGCSIESYEVRVEDGWIKIVV